MDWTALETATFGSVMVIVLGLLYRFLGQRTDPKLLELFKAQMDAAAKRDEDNNETNEKLAEALNRSTAAFATVKSGMEMSFNAFAQSIQEMVSTVTSEHQMQLIAIGNIPTTIIPAIDTLTSKLENQIEDVQEMNNTVKSQDDAIQQILDAVLRLDSRVETLISNFDTFQQESQRLGAEIQETKKELTTIKSDVSRLKPAIQTDSDKPKAEPKLKTIPIGKETTE